MNKIADFVIKKRVVKEVKTPLIPWYKRPLERSEFAYREAKDGKLYIRHNEWSKKTWIGTYNILRDVEDIVDAYVKESLKNPLDRKTNHNIHSITVEDERDFFKTQNITLT